MTGPLVSVIIPTYNRKATISLAVQSALDQTYQNLEVIVVDDGSTDGTASVLRSFQDRIRVVHQRNAGPSSARNRGVGYTRGEIIAFLDSDDVWYPTKIARQVRLLQRLGPSVPCCLCNIEYPDGARSRKTSFELADLDPAIDEGVWHNPTEVLLTRFVHFNQAIAVRKEALMKAGLFKEDLRLLEDYDLALRLSLLGPWGVIKTPLVRYGTGQSNSLTTSCSSDRLIIPRLMKTILTELSKTGMLTEARALRVLRREMAYSDTRLRAAYCASSSKRMVKAVGVVWEFALRLYEAIQRRSPFFAQMSIVPVDEFVKT